MNDNYIIKILEYSQNLSQYEIADLVLRLKLDENKERYMEQIHDFNARLDIIKSFSDAKKIEYLEKEEYPEPIKAEIIASLSSDKKKVELLDTIKDEHHRVGIIESLKSDSKKMKLLDTIKTDYQKVWVVCSMKSDRRKERLLDQFEDIEARTAIISSIKMDRTKNSLMYTAVNNAESRNYIRSTFESAPVRTPTQQIGDEIKKGTSKMISQIKTKMQEAKELRELLAELSKSQENQR